MCALAGHIGLVRQACDIQDVVQLEPELPCVSNEDQALQSSVVVAPLASRGPVRLAQETAIFIKADRRHLYTRTSGNFAD